MTAGMVRIYSSGCGVDEVPAGLASAMQTSPLSCRPLHAILSGKLLSELRTVACLLTCQYLEHHQRLDF